MALLKRPFRITTLSRRALKAVIHVIALGYLIGLFYAGITDNLGPDPVETLLNETGIWTIHILFATLMLTPLAKGLPSPEPIKFRRMLGIYSFVYALAHFATYILFELQLDMSLMANELVKRPYIVVGLCALVLLLALTITSLGRIRRLMGTRWQQLHNTVYLVVPLALLHFSWSQKTLWQEPVWYWLFAILLLSSRVKRLVTKAKAKLMGKRERKYDNQVIKPARRH